MFPVLYLPGDDAKYLLLFTSLQDLVSGVEFVDVTLGDYMAWDANGAPVSICLDKKLAKITYNKTGDRLPVYSLFDLVHQYAKKNGIEAMPFEGERIEDYYNRIDRMLGEYLWSPRRSWWRRILGLPASSRPSDER